MQRPRFASLLSRSALVLSLIISFGLAINTTPTASAYPSKPMVTNDGCIKVYQNNVLISPGGTITADFSGNWTVRVNWSCTGPTFVTVTMYTDWHPFNGGYGPYRQYFCAVNCSSGWINPDLSVKYGLPAATSHALHIDTGSHENDYTVVYPVVPGPTTWSYDYCSTIEADGSGRYCYAPTVTSYCGPGQYYDDTDGHGVPLQYTGTNGNSTCVQVTYTWTTSRYRSCDYYFYVPYTNEATALIVAHLSNGRTVTLDESTVSGWQYWFTEFEPITSLTFGDGNGQPVSAYLLGWSEYATRNLQRICKA